MPEATAKQNAIDWLARNGFLSDVKEYKEKFVYEGHYKPDWRADDNIEQKSHWDTARAKKNDVLENLNAAGMSDVRLTRDVSINLEGNALVFTITFPKSEVNKLIMQEIERARPKARGMG